MCSNFKSIHIREYYSYKSSIIFFIFVTVYIIMAFERTWVY